MNRVSSAGSYSVVLAHLNEAQARQIKAGAEVSTGMIGSDLKGFARNAEALTSMNSIRTRVNSYLDQNRVLEDRFATQDLALTRIADAAAAARQTVTEALASGRGDTLMQELGSHFNNLVSGLNSKSQGKYLFAGGQLNTQPVDNMVLSDLTLGTVASRFHNDSFVATTKLDESTSLQGGFLASDLGTEALTAFRTIQAFQESVDGPFDGELTENQRAFLEAQLATMDDTAEDLTNQAARNGSYQRQVEDIGRNLTERSTMMEQLIGDVTDVDMPDAISRLELSKIAIQASAEVFTTLRDSSLLNYLRI